ncbi:hypothetical protein BH11MYX1_BH11MYX1_15540 [soil metagenome]
MQCSSSLLALLVAITVTGCEKPNDLPHLRADTAAIGAYYEPVIVALTARGGEIVERGGRLGIAFPGGDAANKAITMAGQQLAELRNLVSKGADGKSELDKQADTTAKDGNAAELAKLNDESTEKLEVGTRLITNELNVADTWLGHAEAGKAAMATTPVPMPSPAPVDRDDTAPAHP